MSAAGTEPGPAGSGGDSGPVAVSVIIVTWNSRAVLPGCLDSLDQHPPPGRCEVIVVDNGSSDGTVEWLRASGRPVRIIANRENRGLPAANNQAIAASRGETLLICNPDVVFHPGAAAALVDLLERRPRAGIAIPRLRYPDGALQTSAGDLPTLANALKGRQAQRRRLAAGTPQGFWWDGWPHDEERTIGRGHEAAYVVRRGAVAEVGVQDEGFRLDWEGIDWMARFGEAGWEVWLCPAAEVVHLGGASIRQVPIRWVTWSHVGMYRYFAKRRPRYWHPALAVVIGARGVAKLAATMGGMAMYERAHRGRPRASPRPPPPPSGTA